MASFHQVEREDDLAIALQKALNSPKPFIIDIFIDPNIVAPSGGRNRTLKTQMSSKQSDQADYIEPNNEEAGIYFHWLSFVNPALQTPMIMKGIHTVHTAECRSLKAILEK